MPFILERRLLHLLACHLHAFQAQLGEEDLWAGAEALSILFDTEDFDVNGALVAADEDEAASEADDDVDDDRDREDDDDASASSSSDEEIAAPRPLEEPRDPEAAQRALGNEKFAKGDYDGAIRCYTLCLGLKKNNALAFSNRAMAYLKQKEFHNAENDCTVALSIDEKHVKTLQRRATARHALGKHRAAFVDASSALTLAPDTKALVAQKATILKALRESARNAPYSAPAPVTED